MKLVNLYHILLSTNLTFKERQNPYDITVKSINPRVNEKRLKDYNAFNKKQEEAKQHALSVRQFLEQMVTELGLSNSIDELKSDIVGSRQIVKKLFKSIFPLYGIELDDRVINRIFGRITFKKLTQQEDVISLFTNNTSFAGSLRRQFSITQSGQANGLFSAFFMRSAGLLDGFGNDRNFEQKQEAKSSSTHNPFSLEKQALRILAKIYVTCYSNKNYS